MTTLDPLSQVGATAPRPSSRTAAAAAGSFAHLSVQRGEPLSVLLADLSEELSFIHAESLEDEAKKEKPDAAEDSERRRHLERMHEIRAVWGADDASLNEDVVRVRAAFVGGREPLEKAVRDASGGDASRAAAILESLTRDETLSVEQRATAETALQDLLHARPRAVEAGLRVLPISRAQSEAGGQRLSALQSCYQEAVERGGGLGGALAATLETFGVRRFASGCDFLSRAAAHELGSETRPLERLRLSEVLDRIKGLRIFQTAAARLNDSLARVARDAGAASSLPTQEDLTRDFFVAVSDPVRFEEAFTPVLESLAPEPRLHLLQELRGAVRELPDWVFARDLDRLRLLQPVQERIDHLVYEEGV